jgi:hypothetical protein
VKRDVLLEKAEEMVSVSLEISDSIDCGEEMLGEGK